jgi:protein-tyrosine phosphatase
VSDPVAAALRATHAWFEAHSGWGEPTREVLEEWFADAVCQSPDECWVAPRGICEHGLASWWLTLRSQGDHTDLDEAVPGRSTLRHAPNFRDIGGITTPDGSRVRGERIYRSGVFDQLDDIDRSALRALGIRTAIDLRSDDERAVRVNDLPDGIAQLHRPVQDVSAHPTTIMERIARGETDGLGAEMLMEGNRFFVERQAHAFGDVARTLLDPDRQPAIVHCTAGKDRTGFAIACVLWVLGVDHEQVVDDYLRTNEIMRERHEQILAAAAADVDTTKLREMLVVDRAYLDAAFDTARSRYGSIEEFIRSALGIDDDARDQARRRLLVPSGG